MGAVDVRTVSTGTRPGGLWRWVAFAHGAYYLVTGVWPVIDVESFQAVTGPKTDLWLVKLFGLLVCVPGAVLTCAARRRRLHVETVLAAIGAALMLALGDLYYVLNGTLSRVYLLDALAEAILLAGWALTTRRGSIST